MEVPRHPDDLARLLVARLNARDVDGIVALYEQDAVLALPDGSLAEGAEAIRAFFTQLAVPQTFELGRQSPALVLDDLALTSTVLSPEISRPPKSPAANPTAVGAGSSTAPTCSAPVEPADRQVEELVDLHDVVPLAQANRAERHVPDLVDRHRLAHRVTVERREQALDELVHFTDVVPLAPADPRELSGRLVRRHAVFAAAS
jgi:hypothetical protein